MHRWPLVVGLLGVAVSLVAFTIGGGPWALALDAFVVTAAAILIALGWPL